MSNQIVISSGAKVRNLDGVLTGSTGVVGSVPLGAANGVATLDSGGKVPVSQLPSSVVTYLGTWNAATNTPTLTNGTGDAGDMYICNVAGTVNFGAGPITFAVGDWVLYGSGTWQKSNGQNGTVTSVAVTESGDALSITGSPITTAGTINIGFAGNSGQYINGEGNLTTFPSLITEAQNLVTEVYNSTGATLTKGTVVYINGGQGNLPTITKAIATGDSTSAQTYGVVRANISNNNNGYVTVIGSLTDIDTQAYAAGTQLYLSGTTAGAWTSTKPSAPIHLVYVGIVVRSHPTQGVVEIRIQNGYEISELHDVAISSVANNDGIFYNSSNDLWENKTIDEALGYTPANDSLVVKLAGTQTITGSKTFSLAPRNDGGILLKDGVTTGSSGYVSVGSNGAGLTIGVYNSGTTYFHELLMPYSASYNYTFPAATGTIALTSNLSAYLPLTGGTLTGALSGTSATFSSSVTASSLVKSGGTSSQYLMADGSTSTLSNPVTGTGTTNYLPKFTGTSTIGNSNLINDASGNLGLGVTPSAWSANWRAIQLSGGSIFNYLTSEIHLGQNFYYSTSAIANYQNNGFASDYWQYNGQHIWMTAPSGTAGNAISFTQAMTLNASGRLGVGTTSLNNLVTFTQTIGGSPANISELEPYATLKIKGRPDRNNIVYVGAIDALTGMLIQSGTTTTAASLALNPFGGNVLIGTTTDAGFKLDVNGTGRFSGQVTVGSDLFLSLSTASIVFNSAANFNTQIYQTGGSLVLYTGANPRLTIASTGAATFSSSVTAANSVSITGNYPSISLNATSGTNFYIESTFTSNRLSFGVIGNAPSMAITSGGNVGIGTSSPDNYYSTKLVVAVGDENGITIAGTGDNFLMFADGQTGLDRYRGFIHYSHDSNFLAFGSDATERMRITSGGNLLVGKTTNAGGKLQVSNGTITFNVDYNADGAYLTAATDNNVNYRRLSYDATDHVFLTSATERMRITSGGDVAIGDTSASANLWVKNSGAGNTFGARNTNASFAATIGFFGAERNTTNNSFYYIDCYNYGSGTYRFRVADSGNVTNTNNSYGAISDIKLKENIVDASPKLDDLLKVKIKNYNYIGSEEKQLGVIAQELEEVFPSMIEVHNDKDQQGKDLGTTTKSVKYSVFVPMLIKAMQEQNQLITELEARIKQLENK